MRGRGKGGEHSEKEAEWDCSVQEHITIRAVGCTCIVHCSVHLGKKMSVMLCVGVFITYVMCIDYDRKGV